MANKKDDRLKVREIRTGEIFTFVEYVDNSRILVYDKDGWFKTLYMYDVADVSLEDFKGCYAVGGVDLSQTTDLTAASVTIEKDGVIYAFTTFLKLDRDEIEYGAYMRIAEAMKDE